MFKDWLKSKANIALVCCLGGFLLFALLGNFVYAPLTHISMLFLVVGLVVFLVKLHLRKKALKQALSAHLAFGNITTVEYKILKKEIVQINWQIVLSALFTLTIAYVVVQGLLELLA